MKELSREQIKSLCVAHGGLFHGPWVETLSIQEHLLPALFKSLIEIALDQSTPAPLKPEYPCKYCGDPYAIEDRVDGRCPHCNDDPCGATQISEESKV